MKDNTANSSSLNNNELYEATAAEAVITEEPECASSDDQSKIDKQPADAIAKKAGAAVLFAAGIVKEKALQGGDQFGIWFDKKRRELDVKTLKPIFPDDLDDPGFFIPKMIRICDIDKKHAESDVCVGSIGHRAEYKGLQTITIYPDKADVFGLSFYPNNDCEVYYVDPSDRNHYISLDDYFSYLKIARVNELQRIAQDLGATHFKVTFKEEKKTLTNRKETEKAKGTKGAKGKKAPAVEVDATVEREYSEEDFSTIEVVAEMNCEGHKPSPPALAYFSNDLVIKGMIELRMAPNQITHQHNYLNFSNSSGIKVKDALKIDAALSAMKLTGNATVTSEVQSEARRVFEYEIDY